MTEARTVDLIYGHPGEPTYDTETQEWHFPRVLHITQTLKPIGQPTLALEPSLNVSSTSQDAARRSRNVQELTQLYPDLAPAAALLPGLAQISEVVNDTTSVYEPKNSELLAFGKATDADNPAEHAITLPIAAVAGGLAGEVVTLILLSRERLGWGSSAKVALHSLTAKGAEKGWWVGNPTPVRQLIFAEHEGESNTWLAVRYDTTVSILRPLLRRYMASDFSQSSGLQVRPSRLFANHIATVTVQQSDGAPFVDISFNPGNARQFATVDQEGQWNIWNVHKKKGLWNVSLASSGRLFDINAQTSESSAILADGWCSISWAGNGNMILVASRTELVLFDIKRKSRRLVLLDLALARSTDWVLDIKKNPSIPSQMFIVTSSRVLWLDINASDEVQDGDDLRPGDAVILSWRHYRDERDNSLRLNVLDGDSGIRYPADHDSVMALLYSRLTGLVTIFTFEESRSTGRAASISDPFLLPLADDENPSYDLGGNHNSSHRNPHISAMVLKPLEYKSQFDSSPTERGKLYVEKGIKFYQLNILYNDLALMERLYAGKAAGINIQVQAPDTRTLVQVSKSSARVIDDFIVPNVLAIEELQDQLKLEGQYLRRGGSMDSSKATEDPLTINFEWLRDAIEDSPSESHRSGGQRTRAAVTVDEYKELLSAGIIEAATSDSAGIKPLHDLGDQEFSILDIDEAAITLTQMLESAIQKPPYRLDDDLVHEQSYLVFSTLLTPAIRIRLGLENDDSLPKIYECLVRAFITHLSQEIPGRVRIATERTLRDIAAQIYLASRGMRVDSSHIGREEVLGNQVPMANAFFDLPVRKKSSTSDFLSKGKEKATDAISALPSSPISEDSGHMLPGHESTAPQNLPLPLSEDSASQRLRALVSLAPQPTLPPKLSNTLSHWTLGDDPATYDWEAAQAVTMTEYEEETELQPKNKHRKRPRESMTGSSSQPLPKRWSISQPQQAKAIPGSSQMTEGALAASQPQRGRHGGQVAKVKKPKRPAGF